MSRYTGNEFTDRKSEVVLQSLFDIKKDLICTKEMQHYITTENIESFLWCIIPFFETY